MNCRRKQQLLVDYVEGILSDRKMRRIERHLSSCENCREHLAQLKHVRQQVRSLEAPEPSAEDWRRFQQELSRKISEQCEMRDRRVHGRPALLLLGAGAFALAVVMSFILVRNPFRGTPASPGENRVEEMQIPNTFQQETFMNSHTLLAGLSDEEIEEFADDAIFAEDENDMAESPLLDIFGSNSGFYEDFDELSPEECDEVLKRLESI
jgi:hypothetical protein